MLVMAGSRFCVHIFVLSPHPCKGHLCQRCLPTWVMTYCLQSFHHYVKRMAHFFLILQSPPHQILNFSLVLNLVGAPYNGVPSALVDRLPWFPQRNQPVTPPSITFQPHQPHHTPPLRTAYTGHTPHPLVPVRFLGQSSSVKVAARLPPWSLYSPPVVTRRQTSLPLHTAPMTGSLNRTPASPVLNQPHLRRAITDLSIAGLMTKALALCVQMKAARMFSSTNQHSVGKTTILLPKTTGYLTHKTSTVKSKNSRSLPSAFLLRDAPPLARANHPALSPAPRPTRAVLQLGADIHAGHPVPGKGNDATALHSFRTPL